MLPNKQKREEKNVDKKNIISKTEYITFLDCDSLISGIPVKVMKDWIIDHVKNNAIYAK